jgi:hypothetical protein
MVRDEEWAIRRRAIETGRHWSSPNGLRARWHHGAFSLLLNLLGGAFALTPWHARGVRNALDLELTRLELQVAGLPSAFDGYRILHVSDSHLDILPVLADIAARLLDGVEVDLLAITGDVHGRDGHPLSGSVGPLKRALSGIAVRDRRLAVLGNHDPVEMIEALEALGIETLVNRTTTLSRGDAVLHVTGLDDVHSFYSPAAQAALDRKIDGCRIALVHSPEMADRAASAGCSLYLCGHTHGGQVCLPGGRPVFTQLVRFRHAASGLWREGEMIGYTSPGLGVAPPTLRFNSRGGAALITLRR